jgi:hypothetical protein
MIPIRIAAGARESRYIGEIYINCFCMIARKNPVRATLLIIHHQMTILDLERRIVFIDVSVPVKKKSYSPVSIIEQRRRAKMTYGV